MKTAAIKNEFEGPAGQLTKFDRKYLHYVKEYDQPDSIADKVFSALRAGNLEQIETSLTVVANNMRANILLIGLSCLIIEREGIYIEAGYRSYLEYSGRLFEKLEIAPQTLSDAKNIMAAYIDHYKGLLKNGFKLGRNAHKLRYLEEAIENHGSAEKAYKKVSTATFREFVEWARKPRQTTPRSLEPKIKIKIDGGRILIDGKNILNMPDDVPEKVKECVARDLSETFRIRAVGNEPFIVETYDQGEQRAIDIFLKKYRSGK
jgi:hypothetical protein